MASWFVSLVVFFMMLDKHPLLNAMIAPGREFSQKNGSLTDHHGMFLEMPDKSKNMPRITAQHDDIILPDTMIVRHCFQHLSFDAFVLFTKRYTISLALITKAILQLTYRTPEIDKKLNYLTTTRLINQKLSSEDLLYYYALPELKTVVDEKAREANWYWSTIEEAIASKSNFLTSYQNLLTILKHVNNQTLVDVLDDHFIDRWLQAHDTQLLSFLFSKFIFPIPETLQILLCRGLSSNISTASLDYLLSFGSINLDEAICFRSFPVVIAAKAHNFVIVNYIVSNYLVEPNHGGASVIHEMEKVCSRDSLQVGIIRWAFLTLPLDAINALLQRMTASCLPMAELVASICFPFPRSWSHKSLSEVTREVLSLE